MKKRVISLLLTMCMILTLCVPTALASPIEKKVYNAPSNARWGDDYEIQWDSEYLKNHHNDGFFSGFEIMIRYVTEDPTDAEDLEKLDWKYLYSYGRTYYTFPDLRDFSISESGWYSFCIRAYGDGWEEDNLYYEYTSDWSAWSEPVYIGLAEEPLPAPVDLRWDGSSMVWSTVGSANVEYFKLVIWWYNDSTGSNHTVKYVYPEGGHKEFSCALEDVCGGEEGLLQNGAQRYWFTVQAISADAFEATDSELAECQTYFVFTGDVSSRLPAPTGLEWDGYTMTWDEVDGSSRYDVDLYYQRTEELTEEEKAEFGIVGGEASEEIIEALFQAKRIEAYEDVTEFPRLDNYTLESRGGNYWFKVRALSDDLSKNLSSEWSEVSDKIEVTERFKLPAPTELSYNEKTGAISWIWNADSEQKDILRFFLVELYYRTDTTTEAESIGSFTLGDGETSTTMWKEYAQQDGLYSFKVIAYSDDWSVSAESDWSAMSTEFAYELPDPLPSPTNVTVSGSTVSWTGLSDLSLVGRYQVAIFYCGAEGNAEPELCSQLSVSKAVNSCTLTSSDFSMGDGVYTIKVRATSSDITLAPNSAYAAWNQPFIYTTPTEALPAPTGLHWDGNTMKWDLPEDLSKIARYEVRYYSINNPNREIDVELEPGEFLSIGSWVKEELGDNVTFKVRAGSGDLALLDSDWAVCETFYEPPAALPAPEKARWDDDTMIWSWSGDWNQLGYFVAYLYYAENESDQPEFVESLWSDDTEVGLEEWTQYADREGLYSFSVRAMSADRNEIEHSAESDMSKAFSYTPPEPLTPPTNPVWDGSAATWTPSVDEAKDLVSEYEVVLYYWGTDSDPLTYGRKVATEYCSSDYRVQFDSETFQDYGAGNYKFGVRAMTMDPAERSNSYYAMSQSAFAYTVPETTLAKPSGLRWDGLAMKWNVPEDTSDIRAYCVELRGVDTDKASVYTVEPGELPVVTSRNIERLGENLKFRVQALSSDISRNNDSAWSDYSEVFTYTGPVQMKSPANLTYNPETGIVNWDAVPGAKRYEIEIYYAETKNGSQELIYEDDQRGNSLQLTELCGMGWYFVKVRALSSDDLYTDSDWAACSAEFSTMIQLGTPTELTWGKEYHWNNQGDRIWRDVPGVVSWKRGLDQAEYEIKFYQVTENGDQEIGDWYCGYGSQDTSAYFSEMGFLVQDFESGTYYFTVQALGDGINYSDGGIATSDTWTYKKPAESLPVLEDLTWKGSHMIWGEPENPADYYGFNLAVFFAKTLEEEPEYISDILASDFWTEEALQDWIIEEHGEGRYWFRVRGLSMDIEKWNNSPWTELCGPYNLGDVSEEVNDNLSDILDELDGQDHITADKVVDLVYDLLDESDLSIEDLANAMSADDGAEGGTLELIAELEECAGVSTTTEVDEEMEDVFDVNSVSVVGAGLNADDVKEVTLQIGKATEGVVIPTQYSNTVQFSMHLPGGVDADDETEGQQLVMPVSITLPVPKNINPAFLVVLHYIESEGNYEEILPYIFEKEGQWFASFTVTSFSDFALATINMEAIEIDEGVVVIASLAVDLPGDAICAVYDKDGKQLGAIMLEDVEKQAGVQELFIPCDSDEADQVKLFVLNATTDAPMYAVSECAVSKTV